MNQRNSRFLREDYISMDEDNMELSPEYKPKTHKNIRGKDYFSKQLSNNSKQLK